MKILPLLLVAICMQVSGRTFSQEITLSLNNAKLETVFKEIQKQTDYRFVYTREELAHSKKVSIDVKNATVEKVLRHCMLDQPITYVLEEKFIIIRLKEKDDNKKKELPEPLEIRGRIINEQGEPLVAVTIAVKGGKNGTTTNDNGDFVLNDVTENTILIISSIGYQTQEIRLHGSTNIIVRLKIIVSSLDETVVIAYGTTTKRLNTGSVGRVTAEEISRQPVSNPLAALHGRIPGLIIKQTSGVSGGKFNVEIRGRNSIAQGSEPLFIIDGVPFASNNNNINQLTSALAPFAGMGLSPLNGLNSSDIESIEILKDADATAIYGSRGANGVILISTKKGMKGKTKVNLNFHSGFNKVSRTMDMMNTQEYVRMRKEVFLNDQVTPDIFNAPDLLIWDTTRYTDLKNILIGGKSYISDAQISVSGGNSNTQFLMGAGYHYESAIFSQNLSDKRGSFHLNLHHGSTNQKFNSTFVANYSYNKNQITSDDLTSYMILPPNLPSLYKPDGKLNWEEGGVSFINPLGNLLRHYIAKTDNLLSNLQLGYKLLSGLTIKASLGYNVICVDETNSLPKLSQNPQTSPSATASFGNNKFSSWSIEPQAEYQKIIRNGKLNILIGGTWQKLENKRSTVLGTGYTNDALLGSVNGASTLRVTDGYSQYRYEAFFGRINYNLKDKYILNLTGRRDGSSRFGPNKQFANFGATGAAWIFSNEDFVKRILPFLSYGKLRASYGVTGNDQIGDYQYLDTWTPVTNRYQGPGLVPTRLFNTDYSWEKNKKVEGAVEFGFLKDRILINVAFFRNESDNQLVNYRLPGQTGFQSIIKNFPAVVENKGWEINVTTKNVSQRNLKWTSSFNLTIPKNKLVSFPGLKNSSYASTYVEGKSLNIVYMYHLLGVDPNTGIYQFEDVDKDGVINSKDYVASYNLNPLFYGGLNNSFAYKNWELNLFFEFRKQTGFNYNNYPISNFSPGMMNNLPVIMLNRWQKQGDNSSIQKFTQTYTAAFDAQYNFTLSDGRFSDASFIRLKNLYLTFHLPDRIKKKIGLEGCRFYLSGQNLLTITNYEGSDPETQNLFVLPPLKTFTAGIRLTF